MKIIHCADIHLDAKMETNLSKEKAQQRKGEILVNFLELVEEGARLGVSVILIAGDLFDGERVKATTRDNIYHSILHHPEIDFLFLEGNHDKNSFLEYLESVPPNLKTFGEDWTSYEYQEVTITGVKSTNNNQQDIFSRLQLDPAQVNLVVLHGQLIQGRTFQNEEDIPIELIKHKHIDYLALGHVHSYTFQPLDSRGSFCYSGCLEGRGYDECGQKGYVLMDANAKGITHQFVPKSKRTLHQTLLDISDIFDMSELVEKIKLFVEDCDSKDMVQVNLEGEVTGELLLSTRYLEDYFSPFFYGFRIRTNLRLGIRSEDYQNAKDLKGEFIRYVLAKDLTQEDQRKIIEMGLTALSGEPIE